MCDDNFLATRDCLLHRAIQASGGYNTIINCAKS